MRALLAVAALVCFVLAGCGDDDDEVPVTTTLAEEAQPAETAPEGAAAGGVATEDDPPGDGSEGTAPAATGVDGRPPDVVVETTVPVEDRLPADDPYCLAAVAVNEILAAGPEIPGDVEPATAVAEVLFSTAVERLEVLVDVTPRPDGAPDIDGYAEAFVEVDEAVAAAGYDVEAFEDDLSLMEPLDVIGREAVALRDHVQAICLVEAVDGDPQTLAEEILTGVG